ncbi:MAG: hypothetical protein QM783_13725 [Phycisphaerales bacterium]
MQFAHAQAEDRTADAAQWVTAYIDAIVQATRGHSAASAAYSRAIALATCAVQHRASTGHRLPTRRLARPYR